MKNPDRDDEHQRRRNTGDTSDIPDGKELAKLLFGAGESDEPPDDCEDVNLSDQTKEDLDDILSNDDTDE
jgi:hypothetical protein